MADNTEICAADDHEDQCHAGVGNEKPPFRRPDEDRKERHEEKDGSGVEQCNR